MSASEQFSPLSNIPNVHGAYQPQVGFNRLNMFNHMAVALRKRKRGGTTNPCDPRKPLIRVYTGGAMNIGQTHVGLFDTALENAGLLEKGWTIERLSIKNIRETKCDWDSPKYLVDWLLEADIHVILIQGLHQGMIEHWHPSDCKREVRRLEFHPGFPSGDQLQCPVFNADKKHYLLALPTMTNPSFFFPLNTDDEKTEEHKVECRMFMRNNKDEAGDETKFILKMPMVQNSKFKMRFIKNYWDLDPLIHNLKTKPSRCFNKPNIIPADRFRNAIIQPFIVDHRETQVILFGGKPQYCCSTSAGGVLGTKSKQEVMEFAREAWEALRRNTNGSFLGDGISRFDIMVNAAGLMKVNEVEHLDANFSKLGDKNAEAKTQQYIIDYYTAFLTKTLILVYS